MRMVAPDVRVDNHHLSGLRDSTEAFYMPRIIRDGKQVRLFIQTIAVHVPAVFGCRTAKLSGGVNIGKRKSDSSETRSSGSNHG